MIKPFLHGFQAPVFILFTQQLIKRTFRCATFKFVSINISKVRKYLLLLLECRYANSRSNRSDFILVTSLRVVQQLF